MTSKYKGELELRQNAFHLIDTLKHIGSDVIELKITDNTQSPIIITPQGVDNYRNVIMPMNAES